MAASSSKPSRNNNTSKIPRTMPDQPTSSQLSCCSSASSARTSELSTAYILSRTDDGPPSYRRGSTAAKSNRNRKNENDDGTTRSRRHSRQQEKMKAHEEQELPPPTITYFPPSPSASMLSVNTYDSHFSESGLDQDFVDGHDDNSFNSEPEPIRLPAAEDASIPLVLPPYLTGPTDPSARPSDPYTFSRLFPSMNRLSIRHDDTTPDGNMNLRVETVVAPGSNAGSRSGPVLGSRRRPATVQLFHLRMHDLANRDFSFRRYCRDSGREVCFSKRVYTKSSGVSRGGIHHSVSSALRSVKAPFRRSNVSNSSSPSLKTPSSRRPSTASTMTAKSSASSCGGTDISDTSSGFLAVKPPSGFLVPTDSIKLEFSNYARVEVSRRGSKRYEFEWWGHKYTWKRAVDKTLNTISFHLIREGQDEPVAHIVQEMQSPSQIKAEERAGGWIPPCYMWISDQSVIEAMTDVADVIVSTGLMVLVDDCIRQRWQSKKAISGSAPLRLGEPHLGTDVVKDEEKSISRGLFGRRGQNTSKPFRLGKAVAVY